MKEAKKQLRKQMRMIRNEICNREEKSKKIVERFMQLQEVQEASCIFAYLSFRSEVSTCLLLEQLWQEKKIVAVPKVIGSSMKFYEISSMDDLIPGYYGILEPKETCPERTMADLIVMPGLAFDTMGHRLGYGGGFYDKFLECNDCKVRVAFAFEKQMVNEIPVEQQDQTVHMIITEERVLRMGERKIWI